MKKSFFKQNSLAYLLILPQGLITLWFFFIPAGEALLEAFFLSDPFGGTSHFVGLENFTTLFQDEEYHSSFLLTILYSFCVATLSLSLGLLLAVLVNRTNRRQMPVFQTLFLWPYAIAPAISGIILLFLFHPSFGIFSYYLNIFGITWNPVLNSSHAFYFVVAAAVWKQVSYNFIFFLGGLQAVPKSLLEAAAIDGAGPIKRFFAIVFPLVSPTAFFLLVMNSVFAFFETFGIIHATTQGGPGGATQTLVYKVYSDGFLGLNLGSSAAQSVILMSLTIILMIVQFKYIEKKVHYGASRG